MDLPRFTSEDVQGWIAKCDGYFELDRTPEAHKVTMASMALDELGYLWFESFKRGTDDPITWNLFKEGIKIRFCTVLRRPLEELMELKQNGKLSEYQERFERISCRSDLTETQKLDCYLDGLKPEIAWDVRLFNPRSVLEATRLTQIKECNMNSTFKEGLAGITS